GVAPGELVVIPRGIKFRVDLLGPLARGFVGENYGPPLRLPEKGVIGSTGLANALDFQIPVAAYENPDAPTQLIHKAGGNLWSISLERSPFDVVAWRGSYVPYKYDMFKFKTIGALREDHVDPSLFCALTSRGDPLGNANMDFMILGPRWQVAENTFRLPPF